MICHLIQRLQYEDMIIPNGATAYFLNGARAVQMFYIISGMMAFLAFSQIRGGYFSYVKRKYLRLFPTYILMIFIYFLIGSGKSINSFSDDSIDISPIGIIFNIFGLHGFSPRYVNAVVPGGWYIGIIWIYFLIVPLLYKLVRNTSAAVKCMFVGLVLRVLFHIIASRYIETPYVSEWADMFILNQFLFLAIGQLLYYCLIKKDFKIRPIDHLLFAATVLYVTLQADTLVFWALIFVVIIVLLSKFDNSVFVNRAALWFGKYSYEIYLCHIGVQYYMCRTNFFKFGNTYLTILVTFIACVFLTSIIAVLVNKLMNFVRIKYFKS